MGYMMTPAPAGDGAGTIALANRRAAHLRVVRSRAWYELTRGDAAEAARLAPALRDDLAAALAECGELLTSVEPAVVMAKLTPLLALTAGAGMSGGARSEWLAAAADALKGVPLDLLERGVRAARSSADHPSRIVPLVLDEIRTAWRARLTDRGTARTLAELANHAMAAPVAPDADRLDSAKVDGANALMRRFGLRTRYRADGEAFTLADGQDDPTASHAAQAAS